MTGTHKLSRTWRPLAIATVLIAVLAAPSWASVASEQQQGARIVQRINAGTLSRTGLSNTQYQRVGQYLMAKSLGSSQAFKAMDTRMDDVMGQSTADQMYTYLGKRYLGVNATLPGGYASTFGPMGTMMNGYHGSLAGMMGRYLNGHTPTHDTGMGTGMLVLTAALAAIALAIVLWLGVPKLRHRGDHPTPVAH